jgi:hypothetical protein
MAVDVSSSHYLRESLFQRLSAQLAIVLGELAMR